MILSFSTFLERLGVSLVENWFQDENVILRDYKVLGTMKVKNVSFEKSVSVRVSFDSWETFSDFEGTYVHGQPSSSQNIDTFSFEFDVPTNLENDATIATSMCYYKCHQ
jgi:protein phosphatase 1 regulatory subunit 3A/B/C/D/E